MAAAKVKNFANIIDGSMTVPSLSENMQTKDMASDQRLESSSILLLTTLYGG